MSKPKKVYIAGPMTGIAEFNHPAFRKAAKDLRAIGYDVVSPAELITDTSTPYQECIDIGLDALKDCDIVALLNGWTCSNGVAIEFKRAEELNLIILGIETLVFLEGRV